MEAGGGVTVVEAVEGVRVVRGEGVRGVRGEGVWVCFEAVCCKENKVSLVTRCHGNSRAEKLISKTSGVGPAATQ